MTQEKAQKQTHFTRGFAALFREQGDGFIRVVQSDQRPALISEMQKQTHFSPRSGRGPEASRWAFDGTMTQVKAQKQTHFIRGFTEVFLEHGGGFIRVVQPDQRSALISEMQKQTHFSPRAEKGS